MGIKQWILRAYEATIDIVVMSLVLLMLVMIGYSFFEVVVRVIHMFASLRDITLHNRQFREAVTNVLDVFVLIELFNIFVNYERTRRIRLTFLMDLTVVFVLRDLLIRLYAQQWSTELIVSLGAILLILVVSRTLVARFSPTEGAGNGSKTVNH